MGVSVLCAIFSMYWWVSSKEVLICADYFYLFLKCLLPPSVEMAGASERHLYNTNDTSSDTEDYTDDRRRRVFKSRVRYVQSSSFFLKILNKNRKMEGAENDD